LILGDFSPQRELMMQDRQKNCTLYIELKFELAQKFQGCKLNAWLKSRAFKYQSGSNRVDLSRNVVFAGENHNCVLGKPGKETYQRFNSALFLKLIQSDRVAMTC
jgi:hypothetical protein